MLVCVSTQIGQPKHISFVQYQLGYHHNRVLLCHQIIHCLLLLMLTSITQKFFIHISTITCVFIMWLRPVYTEMLQQMHKHLFAFLCGVYTEKRWALSVHFNPDPQTWFSSCKHVAEIRCLQEEIWWLQKEDVWSDDEVELLINIAADYKALKVWTWNQYVTPTTSPSFSCACIINFSVFSAFTCRKMSFLICRLQKLPLWDTFSSCHFKVSVSGHVHINERCIRK